MNNKRLGMGFEREVCEQLRKDGYWVHFITPDARGAQPFDIVAARYGVAFAIDCKTSKEHIFRIDRLEDNQIMAFEKWLACGNTEPFLFVKYNDDIKLVAYSTLKSLSKINLDTCQSYFGIMGGIVEYGRGVEQ